MDTGTVLVTQAVTASVLTYLLQLVKSWSRIPWISQETRRLNQFLGSVLSLLTAIGIHVQFDHSAGTLLITGLAAVSLRQLLWGWIQQHVIQEIVYQKLVKGPTAVGAVVAYAPAQVAPVQVAAVAGK